MHEQQLYHVQIERKKQNEHGDWEILLHLNVCQRGLKICGAHLILALMEADDVQPIVLTILPFSETDHTCDDIDDLRKRLDLVLQS